MKRAALIAAVVILIALSAFALRSLVTPPAGEVVHQTEGEETYTCPMHPTVRSDRPGACPVCGMALVRMSRATQLTGKTVTALKEVTLSPTQRLLANVATVPVARGTVSAPVGAVGTVVPAESREVTISARFRGRIERLYASTTGQRIATGSPLFDIYSPDLISAQQEYLISKQNADARLTAASRERLMVSFGMTNGQIDSLDAGGSARPTMTFLSPAAGTILLKNLQQGQYTEEGMALYRLADLRIVWVLLDVYERDLARVDIGRRVNLAVEAYPGRHFAGRVAFVEPVVNSDTRTVRVRVVVPNPHSLLKPNMYVRGEITIPTVHALVIPSSAIQRTGTRTIVWVQVADNTFQPRSVTAGATSGDRTEVVSGVREGELIAASGGFLIDSESALTAPAEQGSVPAGPGDAAVLRDTVEIRVKGGYAPDLIRIPAGHRVTLRFIREEDSACSREVVFPTLDMRRELPSFATTDIVIPPQPSGRIRFSCGMNMYEGTLVVEAP